MEWLAMNANAKTVRLLLHDGTLEGVVGIEVTGWDGELLIVPRSSMNHTRLSEMSKLDGLCVLLSAASARVCLPHDLSRELASPDFDNNGLDKVILITTQEVHLGDSDAHYLTKELAGKGEHVITDIAQHIIELPDTQRQTYLHRFLEEALFLLDIVGIDLSRPLAANNAGAETPPKPSGQKNSIRPQPGTQLSKGQALAYVREQGMDLNSRATSFATLQKGKPYFWINPRVTLLENDWHIVLNDNMHYELIILCVPANTMTTRDKSPCGLQLRTDKPELIDLQIDLDSLKDRRSGKSFAPYVVTKIAY